MAYELWGRTLPRTGIHVVEGATTCHVIVQQECKQKRRSCIVSFLLLKGTYLDTRLFFYPTRHGAFFGSQAAFAEQVRAAFETGSPVRLLQMFAALGGACQQRTGRALLTTRKVANPGGPGGLYVVLAYPVCR